MTAFPLIVYNCIVLKRKNTIVPRSLVRQITFSIGYPVNSSERDYELPLSKTITLYLVLGIGAVWLMWTQLQKDPTTLLDGERDQHVVIVWC